VTLIDVLVDFVQHDCPWGLIWVKLGAWSRSVELIFVLVGGFGVFTVEGTTNADLQNQLSIRIVWHQPHLAIETLRTDIDSGKTVPNFLN
jgi:hypothetical protein